MVVPLAGPYVAPDSTRSRPSTSGGQYRVSDFSDGMTFALPSRICVARPVEVLKFWFGKEYLSSPKNMHNPQFVPTRIPGWAKNGGEENEKQLCKEFLEVLDLLLVNPAINECHSEWATPQGRVAKTIVAHYIAIRESCRELVGDKAQHYRQIASDTCREIFTSDAKEPDFPVAFLFTLIQYAVGLEDNAELIDLAGKCMEDAVNKDTEVLSLFTIYLVTEEKNVAAQKLQANFRGYRDRKIVRDKKAKLAGDDGKAKGKKDKKKK
ncbi:hypothetical protein CYMTET_8045 [Cymbomonas tetramitiformis]|uniref:Uncharacterized protein n=1 Tax=Cymbomonas tetramitiformis TaxID=36881 RepID=A0AAE0LGD7_9CHLO|nr:hypothetical protein CYMTET_8045 [Cymbomonas tetramitiformis]